jgi:hypothetical protein
MVTSNTESGITVAYDDSDNTLDFTVGTLNQDTTGTAATVTGAAQSNITSLGTLTTLTVDNVIINGSTIGHTGDTDLITVASGVVTVAGELDATSLDISGDIDVDGTTNLDVVDIDGAVDMASTLQVDGAITSSAGATITVADNSDNLTIVSTDADATTGPNVNFYRNSSSPADNDHLGEIRFTGRNDNSQDVIYSNIETRIKDASDGTEDGYFDFETMLNGTLQSRLLMNEVATIVNEDSLDIDFRVESNGNANMLFVDAGNDRVGIGSASPSHQLEIESSSDADLLQVQSTAGSNDTALRLGIDGDVSTINATGGSTGILALKTYGTERMRIDGSGQVLVGKTSATAGNAIEVNNRISAAAGSSSQPTFNCEGDTNTGINLPESDRIILVTGGSERMRIDASGDVLMGNTTVNPASAHSDQKGFGFDTSLGSLEVAAIGGSAAVFGLNQAAATDVVVFRKQGTQRGSVGITDSGTSFNTSSDARLKTVLGKAEGLEIVNKLNPVNFEWNESKEIQDGLIAQEVMEIIPHAVSKNSDDYYEMDYSRVVTPLIKAIQEQQEQIDALQSEINLLKGE